jgi:chromate reductase, NAD(P)H dehydrogenase (quinone)
LKILGIPGSLRRDSYNRKVLLNAAALLPDDVVLEIWDGLRDVPPFDEDDEELRLEGVVRLRAALTGADAILVSTPEYNHSIPGQLKNAVDWASRPVRTAALRDKPVAVVGASTGAFGAVWAQAELRKVLAAAGARVVDAELAVTFAIRRFDPDGRFVDDEMRERVAQVVAALVSEARVDQLLAKVA